jgi:uncharacterized membrane protein YhaH (DUF805 family)
MNLFQMMFGEWLELLFSFRGRINRAKYWLTFLIYFIALFALYVLLLLWPCALLRPCTALLSLWRPVRLLLARSLLRA